MLRHTKQNSPNAAINTELFKAAWGTDWVKVRRLIKNGADINEKDPDADKMTLYDAAAFYGNTKMIRWLLRHGFNVNTINHTNMDRLQAALHDERSELAKILIRHGADVNKTMANNPKQSFLHVAVENKQWDVVALLLKHGFRVNPKDAFIIDLFHQASREGELKIVKLLLKSHVDVNAVDSDRKNALHHAIYGHNTYTANPEIYISRLPVIKFLIKQGVNVNAIFSVSQTALSLAADNHLGHIVNLLLENHADINLQDSYNGKPCLSEANRNWIDEIRKKSSDNNYGLHMLLSWSYTSGSSIDPDDVFAVRNYMEHGFCHVDGKNEQDDTMLYVAASCNKPKSTRVLLDYGADINASINGSTTIQKAVKINNPIILEILAKHGSGINLQDANLLMHALVKHQKWQLVRHLARHHADLEGKNEQNETLLQLAVRERNWKTVRCLLKHGAKLTLPNSEAIQLLRHADKKGKTKLVEQLRIQGVVDPLPNNKGSSAATARSSLFHQKKLKEDRALPNKPRP